MYCATSRRPSGHLRSLSLVIILMIEVLNNGLTWAAFVPNCLSKEVTASSTIPYCECNKNSTISGSKVSITCNFRDMEDVVLTDALYPFHQNNLVRAYVQVRNATSVKVTANFLRNIQHSPSVTLDIWRSGTLTFESSPQVQQPKIFLSYNTYIGLGIINCTVPSIPSQLLRDRVIGGLFIRGSRIGTISQGSIFNINKMKYFIIEDSVVERIETAVSNRIPLSLEPGSTDRWHGFRLNYTNINSIASEAFTFGYEGSSLCEAKVVNNRLGDVGTEAITAKGKLDITIRGNTFRRLQKDALKVNVSGDLKFEENVVELLEPGGLKSLLCRSHASMEKNTVHLKSPNEMPSNTLAMPFEDSCGEPQVFVVMSPAQPRTMSRTSNATWVILTLLLLVIGVIAFAGFYTWKTQTLRRQYRRGEVPLSVGMGIRERTTLNDLHNSAELDIVEGENSENDENRETGVSNPIYDVREPS